MTAAVIARLPHARERVTGLKVRPAGIMRDRHPARRFSKHAAFAYTKRNGVPDSRGVPYDANAVDSFVSSYGPIVPLAHRPGGPAFALGVWGSLKAIYVYLLVADGGFDFAYKRKEGS